MSFTFATLKTAIKDYLEVDETTFNDNLSTFIRQAEDRIFKLVQIPKQRKNATGTTSSNDRFLQTPSDFFSPFSLAVIASNKYHYLLYKHPSFIKQAVPDTTVRGRPRFYSLFDESAFELSPVPDQNYEMELHYLHKPPSLTDGAESGTSLLSTDFPDPLLYGSLCEAVIFLKEPQDAVAALEARFQEGVLRMKNITEGRTTRDEYRYDLLRAGVS